jgi:hypothetical protein
MANGPRRARLSFNNKPTPAVNSSTPAYRAKRSSACSETSRPPAILAKKSAVGSVTIFSLRNLSTAANTSGFIASSLAEMIEKSISNQADSK